MPSATAAPVRTHSEPAHVFDEMPEGGAFIAEESLHSAKPARGAAATLASDLGLRAVQLAAQSVAVREEPPGSNWGKAVKAYLAAVGITTPAPWCAAFVAYKIYQAAQQLGAATDWPRTGYCPTMAAWAKQKRRFLAQPRPGCVFLVRDSAGRFRHTGFVSEVHADGTVSTVEGNSNDNGTAEGIGVFALRRSVKRLRFVQINGTA